MDKEKEDSSINSSEASDYLSVGLGSDIQEVASNKADNLTTTKVENIGSIDAYVKSNQTNNTNINDDDDAEAGAALPLLGGSGDSGTKSSPLNSQQKQVKFSDYQQQLELQPLTSRMLNDGEEEEENERIKTLGADEDGNKNSRTYIEETEFNNTVRIIDGDAENPRVLRQRQSMNRFRDFMSTDNEYIRKLKPTKMKLICLSFTFMIVFTSTFFPNCIHSLSYDKIALSRNKLTGVVNTQYTYQPGLHFLLPWCEWLTFDRTAISYEIENLHIFTTDKLEVRASFKIYYFIEHGKLGMLYNKFGPEFESIIQNVIRSELMNLGQEFSIDDYRTKRIGVRTHFKEKLAKRLKEDYWLNLFDLYLHRLAFSNEINNLNLIRMLNGIYNEKAVYEKQTAVTRGETNLQTQALKNEARLIIETAELQANNTVIKQADKNYECERERAFINHLSQAYSQLNFLNEITASAKSDPSKSKQLNKQLMISYCWYSSLLSMKNTRLNIVDNQFTSASQSLSSSNLHGLIGLIY